MTATATTPRAPSLLAQRIAEVLRTYDGPISAPAIAERIRIPEREVRRIISLETRAIQQLAGGLLCSKPGAGFWICTDSDEIVERYRLLKGLAGQARRKLADFKAAVVEFGLGGALMEEHGRN